jgi:titin
VVVINSGLTTISGNYIGTNAAGSAALANAGRGIYILDSSSSTIGGTTAAERNVISGNAIEGVKIEGATSTGNIVQGNYIGTNAAGTAAIANSGGLSITSGANNNTIGGTASGAGNVISGNTTNQVHITDTGTTGNTVAGNYIGTNAAGTADLSNTDGVRIDSGASANTLGGTTTSARNIISGNTTGVFITGSTTTGNVVQGNWVGLNAAGTGSLANSIGISVSTATATMIGGTATGAGNVISGNASMGISLGNLDSGTIIQGNLIGTNPAGTAAQGQSNGIYIQSRSSNALIGGTDAGAGNLISGNSIGIRFANSGGAPTGVRIEGNKIGTSLDGNTAVRNNYGIQVATAAGGLGTLSITIGGTAAGAGNLISGNTVAGIFLGGQRQDDGRDCAGQPDRYERRRDCGVGQRDRYPS